MKETISLSSEALGQIALVQSMVGHLPDKENVFRFVCRGLVEIPGVAGLDYCIYDDADAKKESSSGKTQELQKDFIIKLKDRKHGALLFTVSDADSFSPYIPFIENLSHMLAVIFEERRQRSLNEQIMENLERRTKELAVANDRLQNILEKSQIAMALVDQNGEIYFRNDRFIELFGYTHEQVPTLDEWWPTAYPDPQYRQWVIETWNNAIEHSTDTGGGIKATEYQVTCLDGRKRDIEIGGIMLGNEFLANLIDVTERNRAKEEQEKARKAAEAANQAKSLFLANMSHELRTPLNAVLGFSQLMSADKGMNRHQKANLEIINRSGQHLLQLINDVLDMSKIEAGKIGLEPEDIDLGELIRDVTDMMRVRAEDKGLQLLLDQTSDFPRFVRGDGPKIRQILINLLSNSVKFTDQGGVTLRLEEKNGNPDGITLRGEVQDTGRGIDPEDIERIFQPFEQLASAVEQKGTGLGLAITRQFVELMGGEVSAASQPGKGSTFYFSIRVEPGSPDQIEAIEKKIVQTRRVIGLQQPSREWRILIAEDQLENQVLLQQLLEQVGFQVRIAEDGLKTIKLFEAWHPHFIWMDRRMPRLGGLEATERIRELPGGKDVKIAALTASVFKEQKDELMAVGSDDFVRKPYRPSEIFDCMARHLDLDYIYEEEAEDSTTGISTESTAISAEQITALPQEVREALESAVTVLDVEEIRRVVERIKAIDADLAVALMKRVETFDFTAIKQLLAATGKSTNHD
ncbi:MAG: ATP-binding protein [Candidatus Sedimenticola sp. 6PFRAG7]